MLIQTAFLGSIAQLKIEYQTRSEKKYNNLTDQQVRNYKVKDES